MKTVLLRGVLFLAAGALGLAALGQQDSERGADQRHTSWRSRSNNGPSSRVSRPDQGNAHYKGSNNVYGRQGTAAPAPTPPAVAAPSSKPGDKTPKRISLAELIKQGTFVHPPSGVWLNYNGLRFGYAQSRRDWSDRDFRYSYYTFAPSSGADYSPWYLYYGLPPYVNASRCWYGGSYDWQGGSYFGTTPLYDMSYLSSSRRYAMSDALDALTAAFGDQDDRAVDAIVPNRGRVGIWFGGTYVYSTSADDFYDMLSDLVDDVDTTNYNVSDVRVAPGSVTVFAQHDFSDAWGFQQTVYQAFRFVYRRGDYQISDFSTGTFPWWY